MVKNPPANAGDTASVPGSGRSPGGGTGNPLQYPCLRNAMDRGAWQASMESQSGVTEYTCAHYQYEVSVCLVISDSL